MKFGHYNLNSTTSSAANIIEIQNPSRKDKPPTASSSSSSLFRLNKLRLTTPAFISRFQRRIETFRRLNSRSESPISFRASLFDCGTTKRPTSSGSLDVKRARSSVPKSNQWNAIHQQLATSGSSNRPISPHSIAKTQNYHEDNFYVFGAHTRKIGIKHAQPLLTGRNYAIPANRPKFPTPPKPSMLPPIRKPSLPSGQPNDSSLKDILDSSTQIGEEVEFKVLKDYFETTSYSEIVNDPDFKDYLSRKNYGDILDYLNANNEEPEISEVSSLYKEPKYLQPRPMCRSKSTGNLYDSIGFYNTYDYPDAWLPPKEPHATATTVGMCNSLKRIKKFFRRPVTKHDKPSSAKHQHSNVHKYTEIKKFCQLLFEENHAFDEKVKSATLGKRFSEKKYRQLLERFVKSKGFVTVDEYVYTKFGSILDQTVCSTLASDMTVKPEYSKNYMENIPKRYHVTKQQFLEADLTKNIFPSNEHLYSRSYHNSRNNVTSSKSYWDRNDWKHMSKSTDQNLQFDDRCFEKRYCPSQQTGNENLDVKYRTMSSAGVSRRNHHFTTSETKVNSETLPPYWPRRRRHSKVTASKSNKTQYPTKKRSQIHERYKTNGYRDQMFSADLSGLVPPALLGQEEVLFGNLQELYTFHSDVFLKDLENCISTTELVALCFVQRRQTFCDLYSYYCQNIPRSERLRETLVDTHLFLQECQKRLGHKLPLAAYLLKPVQRITKYQLLLKDLLKFSDNRTCAQELQSALDWMINVIKCVNDSMHQIAITGFPADINQQGELLMQNSFQVTTESKKDLRLRLRPQQRHIFLYPKVMLFCKPTSKTNQNQYQFKHYLKMSEIGITESVRGDPRRFEVWLEGRSEVHTIQASTLEIKNMWVKEINNVLFNQLKLLKNEKIMQYGQHRPIAQAMSWDCPPPAPSSTNQRTMSCDTTTYNQDLPHDDSHHHHHHHLHSSHPPGISSSSSEHDNHENGTWSSDFSNSEDECSQSVEVDGVILGSKFVSLADYNAMGHSEVSLHEGDVVELLKIGCAGWWFVKSLSQNVEGWAPAAYLESALVRKSCRVTPSRRKDKSF